MDEKQVNIKNLSVNYKVFGKGKPLLVLHGWGSNSDRWVDVAELLGQKGFSVIVPDMPGFGKSQMLQNPWRTTDYMDFAEQFAKELKLGDYYLLGHSFGGAVACKVAIKHPQEVQKLFLVSTASVRKKTAKKSFLAVLAKVFKIFSFLPGYALARKAVYKFIIRKSDYPYVDGVMKDTYKNVISEDLSQYVGFIRVPTVIIWGDKDEATPIEDAHFLQHKIKDAKLEVIPGAGHKVNRENAEQVAQFVASNA